MGAYVPKFVSRQLDPIDSWYEIAVPPFVRTCRNRLSTVVEHVADGTQSVWTGVLSSPEVSAM